jgi:superfamily II DNA/RNA helicase
MLCVFIGMFCLLRPHQLHQTCLFSATLSDEIMSLTSVAMQNPVMVKLQEEVNDANRLQQYYLQCRDADKFLLVFALLKLGSIRGKVCRTVFIRLCVGV